MPRGGAHFSSMELAQVLSYYDIGVIQQVTPLVAGNRRAPKMVVTSNQGKFLLKRRPRGKDDLYRVAFAHAVQMHLAQRYFPVAVLLATRDERNTILQLNNRIYEFFKFVGGSRYDGAAETTIDAGRQLARLHEYMTNFAFQWNPLRGNFHDSSIVRGYLKTVGSEKSAGANKKLQAVTETLMQLYNVSSVHVNELGFDSWGQQVVHGDWHPGNMLFLDGKLTAVLDFDSTRIAPPITDLANGLLQFSIVGDRPNPADWPDYLDQAKLVQFLKGYCEVNKLDRIKLDSLIDLMIETMIAEAVLPVATTGYFGNLSGADFLRMIQRKAQWLDRNREKLTRAIES